MVKHVKLSDAVYAACDYLRIEWTFSKNAGGYLIVCTPVQKEPCGFALVIDSEYFALKRYAETLVIPASRRSAKKEGEADGLLADAGRWASEFLARIGRPDIAVVS